jgi:predicted DNA-binding transcriptional regulator AlpA
MTKSALLASTAPHGGAVSAPAPKSSKMQAAAQASAARQHAARQRTPAPQRRAQRRPQDRGAGRNAGEDGDDAAAAPPDQLVPDPTVCCEFGVTSMTLYRWTRDPKLGFPQPVKINSRCYRIRRELEEFKERLMRQAIAERAREVA